MEVESTTIMDVNLFFANILALMLVLSTKIAEGLILLLLFLLCVDSFLTVQRLILILRQTRCIPD